MSNEQPVASVYVHVPFCVQKCGYCAFYSEPAAEELKSRYARALVRELGSTSAPLKSGTVYFGGGTPSLLSLQHLEEIISALQASGCGHPAEWTIECNPATITAEKARFLRSAGVNRVSLGVQSLNETLLERLGRIHTRQQVFATYELLRRSGFENVNIDLMFAIPGQELATWRETLREALALGSEHLSCYEVTYEEDTPLYADLKAGQVRPDEDLACAMYDELLQQTASAGLEQYEVANFARHGAAARREPPLELPSFACRHNVNYWRGGPFLGLGPSATSYIRGIRAKNWPNTRLYCELIESSKSAAQSQEQLSPVARAGETAAFGLRMTAGWPFEQFQSITGFDLRREWATELKQLASRGWATVTAEHVSLTPVGLRFADAAAQLFLR